MKQLEIPFNQMENKYNVVNSNYFGFEIFEDIFKVINERANSNDDPMFKAGIASAEAAVRRLREEHYESIVKMYNQEDIF